MKDLDKEFNKISAELRGIGQVGYMVKWEDDDDHITFKVIPYNEYMKAPKENKMKRYAAWGRDKAFRFKWARDLYVFWKRLTGQS